MDVEVALDDHSAPNASLNQINEFKEFAKTTKEKAKNKKAYSMAFDDEEEAPTMLNSEFETVKDKSSAVKGDEDVDDLALAIKKKKKNKKNKKAK